MGAGPILAERAAAAPTGPGVYVMLDGSAELLYVGKATNVGHRLRGHMRPSSERMARMIERIGDVRWIECADEAGAFRLEADLLVALAPPFNATLDDEYVFVCLEDPPTLRLTDTPARGRAYGGFPHLGKGKSGWTAVRCNAGYSALLRLLWTDPGQMPARLRGTSPPVEHATSVTDPALLRDFLSGRSARLLDTFDPDAAPVIVRSGLRSDLEAARLFFRLGPRAMHGLRRRHGVRGAMDAQTFRRVVAADLREAIGDDLVLPPRLTHDRVVGARTARSMHFRTMRRERS